MPKPASIEHRSVNFNDPDAIGCIAWLALVFFALALFFAAVGGWHLWALPRPVTLPRTGPMSR